jgi:hypothetical protein
MKVILFFSRFTIICNIAFLLFIIFSKIEAKKPVTQSSDAVDAIPYFKNVVITLGFSAIVINFFMCLLYAILVIIGKQFLIPKWFAAINFIFLILQFYFFFF